MNDLQNLKQTVNIVDVIGHFITLKPSGSEFVGLCPFHDDTRPSMTVVPSKQIYWCPVCGATGDAFDFVMEYKNVKLSEAIQIVRDITGNIDTTPTPKPRKKSKRLTPDKNATTPPPIPEGSTVYKYSETVYVTRSKDKKIRPLTFSGGKWHHKAPDKPPLYIKGNGPAILVEGEKTADAVAALGYQAVTWMGGTNRWQKTDFSGLPANVMFWPDNDEPGRKCMEAIATKYEMNPAWIPAPENAPKGWDAADGNTDGLIQQAQKQKRKPAQNYTALGFSKRAMQLTYFFYIHDKNQVTCYTNNQINKTTLRELHPEMEHWGKDHDEAAAELIHLCTQRGLFDPDMIRNRGAWLDDNRVILHTGKKLIVDGTPHEIEELKTAYIYERRKTIPFNLSKPITADQGQLFVDALRLYNWERTVNAELLAGWCFVAPICGALNWRPHIWVSGSSGVGKTKLMKDTVWALLDDIAITPEGESTEAGIRQTLDGEALPVLFDEVEADTQQAQARMDGILNLMRSASSGKSGQIMKGGATHQAKSFRIRSCFAFSSIVYQATKKADRSRITVLGLVRNADTEQQRNAWDEYNQTIHELINADFITGFRSRSVKYLRETLEAAKVFCEVMGVVLSDRRLGDQIGTMIAGCWMLENDYTPTKSEAESYVSSRNFYDDDNDEMEDELQLLRFIMQQGVNIDTDRSRFDMNIGELISEVNNRDAMSDDLPIFKSKLGRIGMKVENNKLIIANSNSNIARMLDGTQWAKNHHKILRRIEGAKAVGVQHFTQGNRSRATAIPIKTVLG